MTLEPLNADQHAAELVKCAMEDQAGTGWTYLPVGPFTTHPPFRALIERLANTTDAVFYAVRDRSTGVAAGFASLMRIDPDNGVIEIGFIYFSPCLQKTRAGTEAIARLMAYVFDELGYRRCEWKCDVLNAPSRQAAERFGFIYEGVFRQAVVTKGRNRDTAWYAIIDGDWPLRRAAFQAWLHETNFDADGRQLRSLAEIRNVLAGQFGG